MKKLIVLFLFASLSLNVNAIDEAPKYKIIANSNEKEDIENMYEIKKELLKDYKEWVQSVEDVDQVLYDHQYVYNAIYKNGIYIIELGNAEGKELVGTLKVNYCENTKEIKKKSLLWNFFFD